MSTNLLPGEVRTTVDVGSTGVGSSGSHCIERRTDIEPMLSKATMSSVGSSVKEAFSGVLSTSIFPSESIGNEREDALPSAVFFFIRDNTKR